MADLTTAFLEGSRQMAKAETVAAGNPVSIGNPVGTVSEYDPRTSPFYDTAFSADKIADVGLKPGQKRGHHGTTIFNPKRNDKEVEAVLGEDKYKFKISKDSPEAIRLKQLDLENMIRSQQDQIAILTQLVAGGQNRTVTPPVANIVPEPVTETVATDYRKIATAAGIKSFGRKKEEVIAELKGKGLM